MTVLLGTVAIEPNRWGLVDSSRRGTVALDNWLDAIAAAGFDGIELWEHHLSDAVAASTVAPIVVLNSYVSFDDEDAAARNQVARNAVRTSSSAVKVNVGADPDGASSYAERLSAFSDAAGPDVAVLLECHMGTIADDPATAERILAAAGPVDRVQAIAHTHEDDDHLRARFDAYGDRITHVHVNHLDDAYAAPRLADVADVLAAKVGLLDGLGFAGSWTIEFVHGVGTTDDHPGFLIDRAADDLVVLRGVLDR